MIRRALALAMFGILAGCMQTNNSNSRDATIYSGEGSAEFLEAREVLVTSCSSCHVWATQSEAEMIASGRIVPGDPENSPVYYRLIGSSGGLGPKDMPVGSNLSSSDRNAIKTWIENAN